MAVATDWPGEYGLPAAPFTAVAAVSGLFDLGPFPYSYLQPALQLTTREVLTLSPIALEPGARPPLNVFVGAAESAEFRRQSQDFTAAWGRKGVPCQYAEIEGANHFTVLDRLFAADSPLLDGLAGS
jgi:arylformamidase